MSRKVRNQIKSLSGAASPAASPVAPVHEIVETQGDFSHRVIVGDACGEWVGYRGVATVRARGKMYAAVTAYFEGALPTWTVFAVLPVSFTSSLKSS